MKILAVDPGQRKIGLAVSDETGLVARPLAILKHQSRAADAEAVARLAQAEQAERLVVGLPLTAEGEAGPQARRVRRWAETLRLACPLPIEFWDEGGSTDRALAIRRETGRRRKSPRKSEPDDAVAAAVILQSYLDAHRTTPKREPGP